MFVTVTWLTLVGVGLVWELGCRRSGGRWTSLTSIAGALWARPPARVLMIGIWAFVGVHVFARYTVPR